MITSSKARSSSRRRTGGPRRWPLLALLALAAAAPPAAAKTLKVATVSPPGSAWMKVLDEAVAEVATATDGRIVIKVRAGGVLGDDPTVLRKMRAGQVQGGLLTAAVFHTIYKDIQVYNLPMAFRSFAEVDAVRQALDPLLLDGLAKAGFECFGIAEVGMAYAMSKQKVRRVADGRRLKVWTPHGDVAAARALEAFGITPIPLAIADVLGSLQTGLIDTVTVPPVAAVPLLWHTQLKYIVDLPLMYIHGLFVVSKRALRGIEAADLAALRRILSAAVRRADELNRADHAKAWAALGNQGIETVTPTSAEVADWRTYATKASDRWVESGVIGREIYGAMQARLAALRRPHLGGPTPPPAADDG